MDTSANQPPCRRDKSKMEDEHEISGINYWTDVRDVTNVVSTSKGIILLVHNYVAFEDFIDFINRLPLADRSTIVYISLNKTYDYLKLYLQKIKPKMLIVDGVSAGLFARIEDFEGASFVRPPLTLNNLFDVIEKYYKQKRPDYIFVDAMSQLLDFSSESYDPGAFSLFSDKLHTMLGKGTTKLVLLYGASNYMNLNLPKTQVERMIRMDVYKSTI